MTELHEIYLSDLPGYVKIAFDGDSDLLSNIHISPGSLDHCVDNTMGMIMENASFYDKDMRVFRVERGDEVIGYTVVIINEKAPNELYSFGINIKYRKKDILLCWLSEVEKILGKPYYIVLWSKNQRAIDFFEKNGFLVLRNSKYLNDETKTLIVCQQEV